MTPKEQALELYKQNLYCFQGHIDEYTAKQCALVAADNMIEWSKQWVDEELLTPALIYLENVKKEIEKL